MMSKTMTTNASRWTITLLTTAALLVAPMFATAPAVAAEDSAITMVRATSDAVLVILRDSNLTSATKRERLEVLLTEHADFTTISKLVMARNWKALSESEQAEFAVLFRTYLTHTYGDNIDNYSNEEVAIVGSREEARGDRSVQTKVLRGGANDILVDYRVRQFDGRWKIIDVVAERISMVSNLRSQFAEVISQGGTKKLMALMREKAAKGATETAATKD